MPTANGTIPAPSLPPGAGHPARRADLRRPTVAGPGSTGPRDMATVLAQSDWQDETVRAFGSDKLWRYMRRHPVLRATLNLLKLSVLANEIDLLPRQQPDPGLLPEDDPAWALSAEVCDFCRRVKANLDRPLEETAFELMDALAFRAKVADKTFAPIEGGPDAGKWGLTGLIVLPRESWAFVVDQYRRVVGVLVAEPGGTWGIYSPEKFVALTHAPEDGDPRGTSILEPAYDDWNADVQLRPQYFRHLHRFGTPSLAAEAGEDAEARPHYADDGITPEAGLPDESPEEYVLGLLEQFANGTALALPKGWSVKVVESKGDGAAFREAHEFHARRMVLAIILATRSILEAQYGSKADSETATGLLGLMVGYLRLWLSRAMEWQLFYQLVELNFGPEVAREHCPIVSLGEDDGAGIVEKLNAFVAAGYAVAESHLPALDLMFGLEPREPGEPSVGSGSADGGQDGQQQDQQDQGQQGQQSDGGEPDGDESESG